MRSREVSRHGPYSTWSLLRHYRFNSVFARNFFVILLIFLVPIVGIGVFFYSFTTDVVEDEMRSRAAEDAERYRDITDSYLMQMQHLVLNLATDDDVNVFLYERAENVDNSIELFEIVQDMAKLRRLVTAIAYIDSIYVYAVTSGYLLSLDGARRVDRTADSDWLLTFEENKERRGIWFVRREPEDRVGALLSVYWNVYTSSRLDGTIIVNIHLDELRALLEATGSGGTELYLTDRDGQLLYSGGRPPPESQLLADGAEAFGRSGGIGPAENDSGHPTVAISGQRQDRIVQATVRSVRFAYDVTTILPLTEFYSRFREMRSILLSLFALGVFASLVLSLLVSVKVFEPVRNILQYIDGFASESALRSETPGSEVKYIADSISRIRTSEREVTEQLKTRVALLRRAQAVALSAQINPHFLYNTLDSIKWTAMRLTKSKNPASEMVSSLSRLLRYSLQAEDSMTTIEEELAHARLYLDILAWRYKEAFTVSTAVEPEVLQRRTVRLSLQPILENAVYHGIKPMKVPGRIEITGAVEDGETVITVRDDGVGLSAAEIEALNDALAEDFLSERKHIGLRNVNQRIRLVFGEGYGLSLSANSPQGVIVRITLPAVT